MKKKTLIIIISIIVVIAIVASSVMIYLKIDSNNKKQKEIEKNIVSKYETFREKVEDFNSQKKVYTLQVEADMYTETLGNYDKWLEEVNKYTDTLENIEKESDYLKENCIDKYYNNQDVKNKCEAFIIAYETAYNYYVKDIKSFNSTLEDITQDSKEKYNEYELKYDFTDINKDGQFSGKK